MWTGQRLSDGSTSPYGLGFEVGVIDGHNHIAHKGDLSRAGYSSLYIRFVNDRASVIVLVNKGSEEFATLPDELWKPYNLRPVGAQSSLARPFVRGR
jgi:hypothetical protein